MSSQCAVWDVTWAWDQDTIEKWRTFFKEYCKKWAFQNELSETGYDHGQGRFSLTSKKSFDILKALMDANGLNGYHLSPTSSATAKSGDLFYVMKADTRKAGPWTDKDTEEEKLMTRQLAKIKELYPYQKSIVEYLKTWEDRKILCIVQPSGDVGKSGFCEYLEYHDLAFEIPLMNDMQDIMQCVMGLPKKWTAFTIDMPKASKKDKLAPFFAGLECLKNGVVYDKRYAFKKRRMDRPHLIVFTNTLPDVALLSEDRWDFRMIRELCLVPYEEF